MIGGGIAGLSAAWWVRDLDPLVLEADDRVGGRIKSIPHGDYWVSLGAHMFPGVGSHLWDLKAELGLELVPLRGELLGLEYRGTILRGGRTELYPFRIPMRLGGRMSMIAAGLKIKRDSARYTRLAQKRPGDTEAGLRQRLLSFLDDRSFADYLGKLHPDAMDIFRAATNRVTAEPQEVAAGTMIGLFAHVWDTNAVTLAFNLVTGPASLPQEIAKRLGDDRVLLRANVTEVKRFEDRVRVRYERNGAPEEVEARTAIVATTAPVTRQIVADLPAETAQALDTITYGPYVVGGIVTNEKTRSPWDGIYSILTADKSFNMIFNHTSWRRDPAKPREPGSTFMVYGGADRARRLMEKTDEQIRSTFVADFESLWPEAKRIVQDVIVQRWPNGNPYATPGRSKVQTALERGIDGKIFLAGDYAGDWVQMESAAMMGYEAAAKVRRTHADSLLPTRS